MSSRFCSSIFFTAEDRTRNCRKMSKITKIPETHYFHFQQDGQAFPKKRGLFVPLGFAVKDVCQGLCVDSVLRGAYVCLRLQRNRRNVTVKV